MREILFRGKRSYNGEWVYGNLVVDTYGGSHIVPNEFFVEDGHHLRYEDDTDKPVFFDHNTLGQFTGLYDSKGNKVFEGDILSFTYDVLGGEWKGQIVFGNPHSRYTWGWEIVPITQTDFNTDILLWFDMEESGAICEVIGNIYDNPELLKEAQNDA